MTRPTMDKAARRSARRVREAGMRAAGRTEVEIRSVVRSLGHHGADEVMGELRLRGIAASRAFVLSIMGEE